MNPVRELVVLHRHRLTQAERALCESRHRLAEAEADRNGRHQSLEAHRASVPARERALYAKVIGRMVKPDAIDLLREELMAIRHEGAALQELLLQSEQACRTAEDQMEETRRAYARQGARTEKYLTLSENFDTAAMHVQQAKEELELEDLPSARSARK